MAIAVDDDNFVRAESNRMFAGLQKDAGGVNRWKHLRAPTAIDEQTVIRMNRDTLYSLAVVDISDGATVTVPDAGDRYLSLMVINQDHYINRIFTEPGTYELTVEEFDTPWVALGARVLVDASNTDDVAEVSKIQDGFGIAARSSESFVPPRLRRGVLHCDPTDLAGRGSEGHGRDARDVRPHFSGQFRLESATRGAPM